MLESIDSITAILRSHLLAEAASGFATLRRTPSSSVIRLLDYVDSLTESDRAELLDSLSRIDALKFFPPPVVRDELTALVSMDPAFTRYRNAMRSPQFTLGLRYEGIRMHKAMLSDPMSREMMAQTRSTLDFVPRDDMPPELVAAGDISQAVAAKAPLMRKLIDKALRAAFATGKKTSPGGGLEYSGTIDGTAVSVAFDFGGMGMQMRYGVTIPDPTKRTLLWRMPYEDLWAAGMGWDYITEENAERSIALLLERVTQIVSLRNQIVSLM